MKKHLCLACAAWLVAVTSLAATPRNVPIAAPSLPVPTAQTPIVPEADVALVEAMDRVAKPILVAKGGIGKAFKKIKKKVSGVVKKISKGVSKVVKTVGKVVKKVGKVVKKVIKKVVKVVKKVVKKIQQKIVGPILKKIKAAVAKLFKPVLKKVMPLIQKFVKPLMERSAGAGGTFGVDSLEKWSKYVQGGKLDTKRIKDEIFQRISGWVLPKIKSKVDSVIGMGMKFIRKLTDGIVTAAVGGIGSIPFVGGLLAGLVNTAYHFGMDELQKLASAQVAKLLEKGAKKLFDATAGKLLTKLIPKVNRFLAKSGLAGVISSLLPGVPEGSETVATEVEAIKQKVGDAWTPEIEAKVREAVTTKVISDHKLGEIEQEASGVAQATQTQEPAEAEPDAEPEAAPAPEGEAAPEGGGR